MQKNLLVFAFAFFGCVVAITGCNLWQSNLWQSKKGGDLYLEVELEPQEAKKFLSNSKLYDNIRKNKKMSFSIGEFGSEKEAKQAKQWACTKIKELKDRCEKGKVIIVVKKEYVSESKE